MDDGRAGRSSPPTRTMLDFLKRFRRRCLPPTTVHDLLGTSLVRRETWPDDLTGDQVEILPIQIDGDPTPARPATAAALPTSPRDAFLVPGGLGVPAFALVNIRDPVARMTMWALTSETVTPASTFAQPLAPAFPAGRSPAGWQVGQVLPLPRLQCLLALRHDDDSRTALVAVLDLANRRLRELGTGEPSPFANGPEGQPVHIAALRASRDSTLVLWRSGHVPLGAWGDVARHDHVLLFTPSERDGLEVLTLALDDGNIRSWGMHGTTLWLETIDGRLRPSPRSFAWSLDLGALL